MEYVLDTNIVIKLLRKNSPLQTKFEKAVMNDDEFYVPLVVHYEMLCGFYYEPAQVQEEKYLDLYNNICFHFKERDINAQTWKDAAKIYADLRRKGFKVSNSDILIAAFCIEYNFTLITENTKDFKNIDGLKFINWVE